ncbi:hypothetical protein [Jiangella muralis]|nr:hypothetical protein [Jiangella muralis]
MPTTRVQPATLVARWVTVADISGRSRTEQRWVPAEDVQPEDVRAA